MESIRYRTIEFKNARVEIGWWRRPGIGLDFEYDVEGPGSSVERTFTARLPLRCFTVHWIRWSTPKVFNVHEMVRIAGRGNIAIGTASSEVRAGDTLEREGISVVVRGVEVGFLNKIGLIIGGDAAALEFDRGQVWKVIPSALKRR